MICLALLLLVGLTLFIGHLVTAGPEREMDAAVQRHVDELNSRYERLFRPEPPVPTPGFTSEKRKQ